MMCQVSCPFSYSPCLQKYAPAGIAPVTSLLASANSSSLFVLGMCLEGSGRLLPRGTTMGGLLPPQEKTGGILSIQEGVKPFLVVLGVGLWAPKPPQHPVCCGTRTDLQHWDPMAPNLWSPLQPSPN